MNTKIVAYDPDVGEVWPDAVIPNKAKEFLEGANNYISTGSELFCYYIRAYYASVDYDFELNFEFKKTSLNLLKSGRMEYYPTGFGDYFDNAVEMLI